MICDNCKTDFEPRRAGRAQRFCPGGKCRARVLREREARKPRLTLVERMEREAELSGVPGMFAHPASRCVQNLRLELGRAAQRLGLLA